MFEHFLYYLAKRKALIKEILKNYPTVNEDALKSLINIKESEINYSKIETHDATSVIVYFIDKVPYFFKIDKEDSLLPTGNLFFLELLK